jgi:feruloyl esterase
MKRVNLLAAISTAALVAAAVVGGYAPLGRASPAAAQPAAPGPSPAATDIDACARLAGLKLEHGQVESATAQAAKAPVQGARLPGMSGNPGEGSPVAGLPAFCRVVGSLHPEPGSNIRFEVWLPADGWDGRLNGIGTGGFAGSIDYLTLGLSLKAGQVGASTDTGHAGSAFESAWAKGHPEKVRDYGWRSIHLTTVAAKTIVGNFYGRRPERAYFIGCSGGGRNGLMEASRYPEDYDGIIAGAPAAMWSDLGLAMINTAKAQSAPRAAIRTDQARLLQAEVLRQCDSLDGQADGLVADPRQCQFDASKLACGASDSPQCFTPPQIAALQTIQAGPRDTKGRQVVGGYPPSGSEAGTPAPQLGWEGYILTKPGAQPQGGPLVAGLLRDVVQKPFATPTSFDFDKDTARLRKALATDLDVKPDLRRFFDRGGKLILWHGWADAAIPPDNTLKFHQRVLSSSGPRARDSTRLFMVPGVQHCMGGTGPAAFGQLNAPQPGDTPERSMAAALQAWVETGRTPQTLVARRGFGGVMGMPEAKPERQRLLCAYPAQAVLRDGADPDQAASYACQLPSATKSSL